MLYLAETSVQKQCGFESFLKVKLNIKRVETRSLLTILLTKEGPEPAPLQDASRDAEGFRFNPRLAEPQL